MWNLKYGTNEPTYKTETDSWTQRADSWLPMGMGQGKGTDWETGVGRASLVAQTVKNQPAMQETWARSLGWEDTLQEGMATHSSIPTWRIPWTEEPGRLQSMGLQRARLD